jgi:hypothetical protein
MIVSISARRVAAPLWLALLVPGCDSATEPAPLPAPAFIVMVSGDHQESMAGQYLSDQFVVRVTDERGEGVGGVPVIWSVSSGAGDLRPLRYAYPASGEPATSLSLTSLLNGTSRLRLRPTALGTTQVSAEVDGLQGSPVTFTTQATRLLIFLSGVGWVAGSLDDECLEAGGDGFIGPDGTSHADVPVGTPVAWDYTAGTCGGHIVSISAPPGGGHFDSWASHLGGSDLILEFVPDVPGTWEYVDEISGATGTLTAW